MIGNKQRLLREKSMKNSPEKKSGSVMLSALKNFGVIFAVCLVIFGLIASFTVTFITSAVDDIFSGEQDELESILSSQNNQGQTKDEDDFVVPSGESFSALFVVTDYDPGYFTYYPEGEELEKLKAEYREALYLVYFEDMSYRDAATVMNKSESQITKLVYRGKQSLKIILEQEGFTYADK